MDISAAFQTIQHHVLTPRLLDIETQILISFCEKPIFVRSTTKGQSAKSVLPDEIIMNNGPPLRVQSISLFLTPYTWYQMARIEHVLSTMLKDNFRELNVIKTKELVLRTGMERSAGR